MYAKYLVLPSGAPDALALMVAHFHCYRAFLHTPRLIFQAAEKGCGKTTALEVTASLSPCPFMAENMTTAVPFRLAGLQRLTVILDECDTWLPGNEAMRGILNAGHRYGGAVPRCEGRSIREYNVFAPVALAGIGALHETLQDRSIVIHLTRAKPGELKALFDPGTPPPKTCCGRGWLAGPGPASPGSRAAGRRSRRKHRIGSATTGVRYSPLPRWLAGTGPGARPRHSDS